MFLSEFGLLFLDSARVARRFEASGDCFGADLNVVRLLESL